MVACIISPGFNHDAWSWPVLWRYGKVKEYGEYVVDEFYCYLYCKCAMGALGL